jgi:endogenous inhibitor of DNA gyrase (YacG/DUF329 family)
MLFRMSVQQTDRPCPICGRTLPDQSRSVCSDRCAQIDLGRWLGEHYRVETNETPDEKPDEPD